MLKEAAYTSYVKPAILCGSKAWCLNESEMYFNEGQRDPW